MGIYYFLCCKTCETAIDLGKKIAKKDGTLVMQGLFSEEGLKWLSGDLVWIAVQSFLQIHENHELIFVSDENLPEVHTYENTEADELLKGPNKGQH